MQRPWTPFSQANSNREGLTVAYTAKGQYYPGGLGNGNLILWLDAKNSGSITKNAFNQVSAWADGSGHGFNFSQATLVNSPVYGAAASPTGRPALTFTSTSSQYLSIASLPATLSFTAGISTFTQVSYNAPQTAKGWQRIFDFGNGQWANAVRWLPRRSTERTIPWRGNGTEGSNTNSSDELTSGTGHVCCGSRPSGPVQIPVGFVLFYRHPAA